MPTLPSADSWHSGVLDPQGPVAAAEHTILLNATVIMLSVIVPVIVATVAVAWWFRAGNRRARRTPEWSYSGPIEIVVWAIPALVVLFLGGIAWVGSHALDPYKPIDSPLPPVDVQVVSLDWKWLFIYPALGVASVNRLVVPAGVPLRMRLTSGSVMNSFFVPQLGSQIYTMAGMTTQLHLQADRPGVYPGFSAQFSGNGFSDMRFEVVALTPTAFTDWLAATRSVPAVLDTTSYSRLARPSTSVATASFGSVADGLFNTIAQGDVGEGMAFMPMVSHAPVSASRASPR